MIDESIIFKNAYTNAPWTAPSYASLFTGLYPSEHRLQNGNLWLDENIKTLAEILSAEGYETMGISNNPWVGFSTGLSRGFEWFDEIWRKYFGKYTKRHTYLNTLKLIFAISDKGAKQTNETFTNWFENKHAPDKPFFVFINYMDTHNIWSPPRVFMKNFLGGNFICLLSFRFYCRFYE